MEDEEFERLTEEEKDEWIREFWATQTVISREELRKAGEFINSIVRPS